MNARQQWQDFKKFALKGNIVDLALAVVIGGAFGKVVDSFVKGVLMPILSYVTPNVDSFRKWHIGRILAGDFLAELVNFLVVAMALYLIINKAIGTIERKVAPPPTPGEPTSKECPYCLSSIPYKAIKCAQCTADLEPAKV